MASGLHQEFLCGGTSGSLHQHNVGALRPSPYREGTGQTLSIGFVKQAAVHGVYLHASQAVGGGDGYLVGCGIGGEAYKAIETDVAIGSFSPEFARFTTP